MHDILYEAFLPARIRVNKPGLRPLSIFDTRFSTTPTSEYA
jgi:hypothetical protein